MHSYYLSIGDSDVSVSIVAITVRSW